MSELDIVLVSYNTAEYTRRAIESVYTETQNTDFKIIMVDNDSKDNSVELIAKNFPDVEIIQTGANLGFAGGVNIGAKASDSEYVLLLNPDTV
ncbi:MAG TPA: glycosyltransferase, partial [Leucothrix mucor]|nr:glycosyltransferase [Leucothrix mucor]